LRAIRASVRFHRSREAAFHSIYREIVVKPFRSAGASGLRDGTRSPVVGPPFRSAWWLPGAHAATLWGKFGRQEPELPVRWETVEMSDGDFVELAHYDASRNDASRNDASRNAASHNASPHNAAPHNAAPRNAAAPPSAGSLANDRTPRLFILHGLEGGVNSNYVRGLMREAGARGWNATLMLYRTCGPTPNRLKRSYHSGETSDPLTIIAKFALQQPLAPIGAVGVSLGGNVLCKLLGQSGDALPVQLQAAAAISAPFDLARASRYIGRGFGRVYENAFLRSLVPKAVQKIGRHPELSSLKPIHNARTIWEFDDEFTSPVHGFANAADYYAQSSSLQFLSGIRRPTLLLSAADDPFLPREVLDEVRAATTGNAVITIDFPAHGGHVGFVGGSAPWRPSYYAEPRAVEFIAQHLRELNFNSIPTSSHRHHEER